MVSGHYEKTSKINSASNLLKATIQSTDRKGGNNDPGSAPQYVFGLRSPWNLTGKTSTLAAWLQKQAAIFGPRKVVACSYTRTAAGVLAGRDTGLPKENVGTLHSVCYRALGKPKLTVGSEGEFSAQCQSFRLTQGNDASTDDLYGDRPPEKTRGDLIMRRLDIMRNRMVPSEKWTPEVRRFSEEWTAWKRKTDLLDFTDLLEKCLAEIDAWPGDPAVAVLDEAQDSTKLQIALLSKWARSMMKCVIAGDVNQLIYEWCGADPTALRGLELPKENKTVLGQSYRLPRTVHAIAEKWLGCMTRPEINVYAPRDADGEVLRGRSHYRYPEPLITQVKPYLDAGKTIMFLATCAYMIDPIKAVLRKQHIPFHNPWRRKRPDWNPLAIPPDGRQNMMTRIFSFLREDRAAWGDESKQWSKADVYRWMEIIEAKGVMVRGGKEWLKTWKKDSDPFDGSELISWLEPERHAEFYGLKFDSGSSVIAALAWWHRNCLAKPRKVLEYAVGVAKAKGTAVLRDDPKVIIGTIHSLKGSEADVCILFPDLSRAGAIEWSVRGERRDSVARTIYVGLTRARETLILCPPATQMSVSIPA